MKSKSLIYSYTLQSVFVTALRDVLLRNAGCIISLIRIFVIVILLSY